MSQYTNSNMLVDSFCLLFGNKIRRQHLGSNSGTHQHMLCIAYVYFFPSHFLEFNIMQRYFFVATACKYNADTQLLSTCADDRVQDLCHQLAQFKSH